jgi:hypothetical protein
VPHEGAAAEEKGMKCKRHNTIVVERHRLRDFFRETYWVRCRDCRLRKGPFHLSVMAFRTANRIWEEG